METLTVSVQEELYHFFEEYGNNRVKRELLAFWGMHPNAKFSRRVICYALGCGKLEVEGALRAMVDKELLDKHITNGVTLYSLTRNEERRRPILELAAFSWDQWNIIIKRMEQEYRIAKVSM